MMPNDKLNITRGQLSAIIDKEYNETLIDCEEVRLTDTDDKKEWLADYLAETFVEILTTVENQSRVNDCK